MKTRKVMKVMAGLVGMLVLAASVLTLLLYGAFILTPVEVVESPVIPTTHFVPVVEYVEVEVEVEKLVHHYIEIEVPVKLEDWESVEELEAFLKADNTDSHIYLKAGGDGVIKFDGQCEDVAIQLRDRAMAEGKHLEVVPLHRAEYLKWYNEEIEVGRYHAICMAIIGNEFWYVEPSDDRCWRALYLD